MSRRKGTPCACECNPCKGKNYVRAVNNVSPDPNGDLELRAGNGIAISQSGDNQIIITNDAIASSFVAGDNIEINPSGDDLEIRLTDNPVINGTLQVNGDIIQQGAAYETHAEKVYTTNDYIYMRDGAVGSLAAGDFSGFQVKKYDGTNDGRLVIDNSGVARVGDVGDEQPLLTREESANLNNGALLKWDGVNQKAIDEESVGSDTKPIKIVNGIATPVTNDLVVHEYNVDATKSLASTNASGTATITTKNGWCCISFNTDAALTSVAYDLSAIVGCPQPASNYVCAPIISGGSIVGIGYIYTTYNNDFRISSYAAASDARMTLTYPIKE